MELSITADFSAVKKLIEKYPQAVRDAQISRVTEAAQFMEPEVKKLTPKGAGPINLRDTIFHKVDVYGESVWGLISTPAKYGEAVEMGTRPHFPPVAPILFWVTKQLGLQGKEAISVAHAIVRKIGKKGTYGTHMFQYAFERNRTNILRILDMIPDDVVASVQK